MTHRLVPTSVAALALGVTPGAVRQMIHRGQLTRYGTLTRTLVDLFECEAHRYGESVTALAVG